MQLSGSTEMLIVHIIIITKDSGSTAKKAACGKCMGVSLHLTSREKRPQGKSGQHAEEKVDDTTRKIGPLAKKTDQRQCSFNAKHLHVLVCGACVCSWIRYKGELTFFLWGHLRRRSMVLKMTLGVKGQSCPALR